MEQPKPPTIDYEGAKKTKIFQQISEIVPHVDPKIIVEALYETKGSVESAIEVILSKNIPVKDPKTYDNKILLEIIIESSYWRLYWRFPLSSFSRCVT
jgi:hypothetical protein